jgi:hypothetical protein
MSARLLLAAGLVGFIRSSTPAADKPEDQAKEAAIAFMEAMKAKDAEAATKLAGVPFVMDTPGKPTVVEKADDLKAQLKAVVEKIKDTSRIPTDVSEVLPADKVRAEFGREDNKEMTDTIEKVLGKSGYVVVLARDGKPTGGVLVAVKDGKAKVVGIPR